ncbi:T9SS C-terminal target domain-containing protein [Lutibacter sp. HS1-25]|uniref:T9SS type A sorting domain-containing protein n=1 Tax=Lutibacter sp. HS1-25 TaxID=2485000 RepID=UPI00101214D7|nr:T9SS type A sorting domain-containing protein [Lutibacter sp. HS1-25]RXP46213.1 T9SS C-terminal target domain-containing protein [Lutibacter sp. HS1-25]
MKPFLKPLLIKIFLFLSIFITYSQTSGPTYIKNELTTSGVFNAPNYEFVNTYDAYNLSTSNSTIKGMFFEGLPYSAAANGLNETKVFCWYGVPNGIGVGEKRPAVILLHGGGGDAYTDWVDAWTEKGYIALAIALEGQVPDNDVNWQYSGPARNGFFGDIGETLQDQWFYHAVADAILANSLLRDPSFSDQIDTTNIGITGISWGGIINNVVTGLDNRFAFSIPVYGCGYLYNSPIYSTSLSYLSSQEQLLYNQNWEPSLYIPLQTSPTLFINGSNDLQFTMNIFTKSFEDSQNEKYLRIEKDMAHGHVPGRTPAEIYKFANYVTGYDPSEVKPLEFTSTNIDSNKQLTYQYNYDGTVDEALLYYTKDTVNWGKTAYNWQSQIANLSAQTNTGTVTTTVPNDAQAYFINVNNTANGLIYSTPMKFTYRDYDWYSYTSSSFNTPINFTSAGVLTGQATNPNTSGINPTANIGKFVKQSGSNSQIRFTLNNKITDVTNFKLKSKIYFQGDISTLSNKTIRVYLINSTLTPNFYVDVTITQGDIWHEFEFDFTNKTIPTDVLAAGGFDQMALMFAPGDTTTNGTVYYFDDIKATTNQEIPLTETYYTWFNYTNSPKTENTVFNSVVGGSFSKEYNLANDADIIQNTNSNTGVASKFTKTAGTDPYTQVRYDFKDGSINDNTITFKLNALFKPGSVSEINSLDNNTRSVIMYLQDLNGGTSSPQISSSIAYFSTINSWENLNFTFTSNDLANYDRAIIIVMQNSSSPKDEYGATINEDFVYYFDDLSATSDISLNFYTVFDYTNTPKLENLTYNNILGGNFIKDYTLANDAGITSNVNSNTGISSKFTKTAGSHAYAKIIYDFVDGTINDTSVTFKLNALFKSGTISDVNLLDNTSKSVILVLMDVTGGTDRTQLNSSPVYFSTINNWEDLSWTFTNANLVDYDRLSIIVMPGYTSPKNNSGVTINEDFVYYFDLLESTVEFTVPPTITSGNIWYYNYSTNQFPATVSATLNGVLETAIATPKIVGNESPLVSKFTRNAGLSSYIQFSLPGNINNFSDSNFKIRVYTESSSTITNNTLTLVLRKDGLSGTQISLTHNIEVFDKWVEYSFNFSAINFKESYYNDAFLVFGFPDDDGDATGNIYYLDAFQGPYIYIFTDGNWVPSNPEGISTTGDIVILSGNTNISSDTECNNLTINPGAGLTVDTGTTLTVNNLTLESTSNKYASLILDGTITGTVNYERYTNIIGSGATGGNDLVSPPLSGQPFDDFLTANTGILAVNGTQTVAAFAPFNNNSNAYENFATNNTTPLLAGKGYRAATTNGSPLIFTGTVNTGTVPVNINVGTGSPWNLIGNPYPSYLDFATFFSTNKTLFETGVYQAVYGYNGSGWTIWNQATIDDTSITELFAPGQGFYVKSAAAGGSVSFTPAMRTTGSSDDFIAGKPVKTSSTLSNTNAKIQISDASSTFKTAFYFNDNASLGLDPGYDAALYETTAPEFSVYSHLVEDNTGKAIAIQSLNPTDVDNINVPLGINTTAGKEVTVSIASSTLPSGIFVYLEDTSAGTLTLLNEGDYKFTATENLTDTGRFFVSFKSSKVLGVAKELEKLNSLEIYTSPTDKALFVKGQITDIATINLFDIQGRKVYSQTLEQNSNNTQIDISTFSTGIYIVQIIGDNINKTKKVIIQ